MRHKRLSFQPDCKLYKQLQPSNLIYEMNKMRVEKKQIKAIGKLADVIIVDGDQLEDVTILQDLEKIKMVMRNREIEVDRGL